MKRTIRFNGRFVTSILTIATTIACVAGAPRAQAETLTWDWEDGTLTGWSNVTYTGGGTLTAFINGHQPQNYQARLGNWSVNTWGEMNPQNNHDGHTGIMETRSYIVSEPGTVDFQICSSPKPFSGDPDTPNNNMTCVNLEREVAPGDWEMIFTKSHGQDFNWEAVSWDTTPYVGETLRMRVYDTSTEGWGHTAVDDIVITGFDIPGVVWSAVGVSSVSTTSALAYAALAVADGGTNAEATLYWGTSDQGRTNAGWAGSTYLGIVSTGLVENAAISNLAPNTVYFYRFYGTNSVVTNEGYSAARTFRTPGTDEWTGADDDLWGNAANWSSAGVPDSGGESALFVDKGVGEVDLDGSSYTVGPVTFNGGDYDLIDTNASPGSLTASSVTNTAGANTIAVGMDVAGTADVSGGTLTLARTGEFDASLLKLNGGALAVKGTENFISGLAMKGYHVTPDAPMDLNNNGGLMALTPWGDVTLTGNLSFNADGAFIGPGAVSQPGNFMILFLGYFNAPTNGNYEFITDWGDDRKGLWLDLDQDGVFESSTPGLGSNRGEQLAWQDGGVKTVALVGGERYLFAVTFGEYGGGESIQLRFKTPLMGGHVVANPGDPAQAGLWTTGSAGPVDLSTIPVNAVASSTVGVDSGTNVAALGVLTLDDGVILTTASGSALGFESTTIPAAATSVGFSPAADTYLTRSSGMNGSGASATIAKTGTGNLILNLAGSNLDGASFDVQSGALAAVHSNAFGGAGLSLNGGELLLSSPTGNITYAKDVSVVADSTLTAGQAGNGVVGPLTNTLSGDITFAGTETLSTRTTDDYTLQLGGEIVGNGTLDVTEGNVIVDDPSFNAVSLNGGALTVYSNLTVNTLSQNSGTFTMAGTPKDLTVADVLILAGVLDFTGANLLLDTAAVTLNNGANVTYDQDLVAGSVTLNNGGTLNLVDQELTADTVTINNGGTLNLGAGPLSVGTFVWNNGGTLNLTGTIDATNSMSFWPQRTVANLLSGTADVYIGDPENNAGYVELTATNTYTGMTQIRRAILRADDGVGLPTSSRLVFRASNVDNPCALETSGTFTRDIGTADGEVYWDGSGQAGGWSALGGELIVSLEGNAPLTWGSDTNGFNGKRLMLNYQTSDSRIELTNPIDLGTGNRTLQIGDNPNTKTDYACLSGVISGAGSPVGSQLRFNENNAYNFYDSLIELTGTNAFTQRFWIDSAAVDAVDGVGLPTNSMVYFEANNGWNEAVLLSRGTLDRQIGHEAGGIYWQGGGGFAARGGPLTVSLEGGAALAWNDANTGFRNQWLQLGSMYADNVVDLTNRINLAANRSIMVFDNEDTDQDVAKLSGVISGVNNWFRKEGDNAHRAGTLWLSASNTYSGRTFMDQGAIRAIDGIGLPTNSWLYFEANDDSVPCVLESNGTFTRDIHNSDGNYVYWQEAGGFAAWGGPLAVNLEGGIELIGNSATEGWRGQWFHFGSRHANDVVTLQNDVNINGTWNMYVFDNLYTNTDHAVLSGDIRNGTMQVYKDGTLTLTGNNTFANLYVRNTTKVFVNGTQTGMARIETVNNNASTFGGNGVIDVTDLEIRNQGVLAPGASVGTLTTAVSSGNGFYMWGGATYEWELGPAAADSVNQTGNLRLDSGWTLKLLSDGGSPRADVEYDLFTYTGSFTGSAIPASTNTAGIPADWRTDTLSVVHDAVGKRIYLTGLYSVLSVANDPATDVTSTSATLNGVISAQSDPLFVSVYWSMIDGGTDVADWLTSGFSAAKGTYSEVVGQPLSHAITGLSSNELWYYTFHATNATGSIDLWGTPSIAFHAAGAPVVTNTGAGNPAPGTVDLGGMFLDHNRAEVTLCWGTTDGGTGNPSSWQNSLTIGMPTDASFTGTASNVLYGAGQYVYRIYAANAYGTAWSDPATAFSQTYNPGGTNLIIHDTFTADNGTQLDGGGDWDETVGWQPGIYLPGPDVGWFAQAYYNPDIQDNTLRTGADSGALLRLDSTGAYIRPTAMSFSVDLKPYQLSQQGGFHFGFSTVNTSAGDATAGFRGLALRNDGRLGLYMNGVFGGELAGVNWSGPAFDNNAFHTVTYTIDSASGNISDISVAGSTADYSSLEAAGAGLFTLANTKYLHWRSRGGGGGDNGYFDNLEVRQAVSLTEQSLVNLPATGVTHDSAWLNSSLRCLGTSFDVVAYWGPDNQTTNAGLWANSAPVGTFGGGVFTPAYQATGLTELTTNYFTFRATNLLQDIWAEDVASFVTDTSALGARFSGTPLTGKSPLTVTFTDTSSGTNITGRFWDFGDGLTTNTAATVLSHTYTNVGAYTVELVVSDAGAGNTSTNTKVDYVFVNSPLICVDFNSTVNPTNYTGPAALGYDGDTWNYVVFAEGWSSFKPVTNLVDSSGGDAGVTFTFTYGPDACFNPWGQGTHGLFGDYMGVWGGGPQNVDMQLSGLAPGTYDLAAFGTDNLTFSANGSVPVSLDGTANAANTNFIAGASYALIHVTVQADGLLTILTTGQGRFGGFQLRDSRGATWQGGDPGGDVWTTGTNWLAAVPGPGAGAIFGHALSSGHGTVDLDADKSVSWLNFLNTVPTTITATNGSALALASQEMPNGDVIAPSVTLSGNGTHTINADLAGTNGLNFVSVNAAAAKAPGGVLVLGGTNTYTGTTMISGPANQTRTILRAGSDQAFGDSSLEFNRKGGQETLIIDLNGFDNTVTGLNGPGGNDGGPGDGGGFAFGCYVANYSSTNPATLTVNTITADSAYLGSLRQNPPAGALGLTKDGPYKLTLWPHNTFINYSGRLTIKDGTLQPNGLNNVNSDGSLGNSTLAVIMGGTGTTGNLLYDGGTTSCNKPFTMAGDGVGSFEISLASTIATLSGVIDGDGGLMKTGAGTLTLSNPTNSWAGDTSVEAGILSISTNHLADLADVYMAPGATLDLNFVGTDTIRELYSNGVAQATGTWGAFGSGAEHESPLFTGAGILNVAGAIPTAPTALFNASPTNGTAPLTVTFTDTSTGTITNRFWDFGNGMTTNTTATIVTSTYAAGTYTVELIVSGPLGSDTNTQTGLIVVSPPLPPTPVFTEGSIVLSGGDTVLSFGTDAGYLYGVLYRDSLLEGDWMPLIYDPDYPLPEGWSSEISTGAPMSLTDTNAASQSLRFYRLRTKNP